MNLKPYVFPLLKWWWLLILSGALAAGASYWSVRDDPIFYQARSTLMIGSPFDNLNFDTSQLWAGQQLAEAYASFAQREPVKNAAMEALGTNWLPEYYAYVPPQTAFIEISVIDADPLRAQLVANELAHQLIRLSPSGEDEESQKRQAFISQQLDDLQSQIEQTQGEIETKQSELGELFSAREISDAQEQISALQAKLNLLQQNYGSLLTNSESQATNTLTIIEPANVPIYPIGPSKYFSVLLAGLLGVVLASGAAFLLELLDDTIRAPEDIERLIESPILAGIPTAKRPDGPISTLISADHPRSPVSESIRDLRTGIQFSNMDRPNRLILVTSPTQSDGKSFISSNLAVVLAQAGYKTIIIDADLRRPSLHKIFKLENQVGLTNLLLDFQMQDDKGEVPHYKIGDYAYKDSDLDLHILSSGSIPPNPSEMLGSLKMRSLLKLLPKYFDYVIVDSPPVLVVTDPLVLSAQTDGVLIVASSRRTRRFQLKQTIKRINEVNANLIGVVLNNLSSKSGSFYYNYYYGEPEVEAKGPIKRISGFFFRGNGEETTTQINDPGD